MNKPVSMVRWLLLALCMAGRLEAQTILEPQLPSQGLVQQQQLWNILVVNNGEAVNNGMIQLVFQEEGSGKKIFTAASGALFIPKGASQLGVKDMGAVRYDYLSPLYRGSDAGGGLLPIGHFIACYHLLDVKSGQLISQNCLPLAVEPFSPPQLAYPADKSDVTTVYPVFNWIAPAPVNMFSNLTYKLIVTEIKNGQTPAEAIQHNPMLFMQPGIKEMVLPYPASYIALHAGKTYAWQIVAQNDNTWAAATDIWSFRVTKDTLSVVLDKAAYPHLQRGPGNTHFIVQQKMKFSYDNEANDSSLTATVYVNTPQGNTTVFTRAVVLRRGMNFIDFTIDGTKGMQKGHEYVLELVNSRNENWDLRFRYEPAN